MFPFYSDPTSILSYIPSATGNVNSTGRIPWIRLTNRAGNGLVLESYPDGRGFTYRYGDRTSSGAVGVDKNGNAVYSVETGDYGKTFNPSPTIESVTVSQGANALSNKFEFSIKCSTIGQLEILQKHFMEPGYAVLVEFGWNTSLSISNRADITNICDIMARYNQDNILNLIKTSNGQYFGILAFITGGDCVNDGTNWVLNVKLTSMGMLPTYIQPHKGAIQPDDTNSKKEKTSLSFHERRIQNEKDYGKRAFMQMFNELPENLKTQNIYDFSTNGKKSPFGGTSGIPYIDECNFINFHSDLIDKINDKFAGYSVATVKRKPTSPFAGAGTPVPSGAPPPITANIPENLIKKTARYISMDLVFGMLNEINIDINSTKACGSTSIPAFSINGWNTVCRAFDNIYSLDYTKLYIPNEKLPLFNITEYFNEFINNTTGYENYIFTQTVDGTRKVEGGVRSPRSFPINHATSGRTDFKTIDRWSQSGTQIGGPLSKHSNSHLSHTVLDRHWGYLKDLYINFDFFKEVVSRSNLLVKDVVLELLNGISAAVQSYWSFELVETMDGVEIVDTSFSPKIDKINHGLPTIKLQGKDSDVLSFNYNIDIPGAMFNKVMANRIKPAADITTNVIVETDEVCEAEGLFTADKDDVLLELDKLHTYNLPSTTSPPTTTSLTNNDLQNTLNDFLSKATYILRDYDSAFRNYRNFTGISAWFNRKFDVNLYRDTVLYVGCYSDPKLFRKFEKVDLKSEVGYGMIVPIKLSIELPGIAGLRVGDLFKVKGGIPQYEKFPFQITRVEHEISQQWITKVEAQIRQIEIQ
jgi:hypothetical protein